MLLSSPSVVEVSSDPAAWIAIVVAVIAVLGSIIAAIVAASSTKASKQFEIQAQRVIELENRISERKYQVYKPMLEMFGDALSPSSSQMKLSSEEIQKRLNEFFLWFSVYGSDDGVIAYHRVTQAAFNSAPSFVTSRLYVEFFLAARRDIGQSDTQIGPAEIIGMKVNNLYANTDYYRTMTDPLDEVYRRYNWTPPWTLPDSDPPGLPPSS
jgi:hypothetical protein